MHLFKGLVFPEKKEIDETAKTLDEVEEQMRQTGEKAISFGLSVWGLFFFLLASELQI
jgi:hypothetical protein